MWGCQKPQPQNEEPSSDLASMEVTTPPVNQLSAAEAAAGWQLLFDGQSADQWRGYMKEGFPENGWTIENGELVVLKTPGGSSTGGDIITREQYENFELSLEFMISDSANSGIFYLAQEQEDTPIWYSAPEYQILDNQVYLNWEGEGDMDMHTHLTAENYDMQAAQQDHSKAVGEWNHARIVVNQGHVEHWLNGQKAVEYDINSESWKQQLANSKFSEYPQYGQATKGHIGLQDHGHEVRFRNIKIKVL